MIKNRILSAVLLFSFLSFLPAQAINLQDISTPKEHFFRFGTTDTPEKKIERSPEIDLSTPEVNIKPITIKETKSDSLTYADLSIKSMAMEISNQ